VTPTQIDRAARAAHVAYYGAMTHIRAYEDLTPAQRRAWCAFVGAACAPPVLGQGDGPRIDAARRAQRRHNKKFVPWASMVHSGRSRWLRTLRAVDAVRAEYDS